MCLSQQSDSEKAVGFTEGWYLHSGLASLRYTNLVKFSNMFAHLKICESFKERSVLENTVTQRRSRDILNRIPLEW